jgi:hypothetical protein
VGEHKSRDNLIYPDPLGPPRLLETVTNFLARNVSVERVAVFGSLARGTWDRWSDIDLLVVARGGLPTYRDLFASLCHFKPILYHSPFSPAGNAAGANVLGIVFAGESVFHILDLNFLAPSEYQSAEALARFGVLVDIFVAAHGAVTPDAEWSGGRLPSEGAVIPESDLWAPMHFTHKALKKLLRGQGSFAELQSRVEWLGSALNQQPEDTPAPPRNIVPVARTFLSIAQGLLAVI